eukprot:gene11082-11162_t
MLLVLKRFSTAVAVSAALMGGGAAIAQTKAPAPKAAAPAPAPAPAEAAPEVPAKVQLQPSQADWTKVCGKDEAAGKEICYTTRDFGQAPDQPPVLALAVYDVKGDDKRILRMLLPVALMLKPGFRYTIDQSAPREGSFAICFPNGCFAESEITGDILGSLKKATNLNVTVRNQVGSDVTFVIPVAGFGKAFDGAAVDPKLLQQQQEELQRQLEERAKKQREELEKNGATAPAPTPAPAPKK